LFKKFQQQLTAETKSQKPVQKLTFIDKSTHSGLTITDINKQ